MTGLIKSLFKYVILLIVVIAAVFAAGYIYRGKTGPLESFIRKNIMTYILPDTTGRGMVIDTVLTPEEELALEIERRQTELNEKFNALDTREQSVNQRRDSIETMRQGLLQMQSRLSEQESQNLTKLAKVYESMKPAEASRILVQLNDQTIAEILSRMKERQAAKVLSAIDPLRAADISTRLQRLQSAVRQNE